MGLCSRRAAAAVGGRACRTQVVAVEIGQGRADLTCPTVDSLASGSLIWGLEVCQSNHDSSDYPIHSHANFTSLLYSSHSRPNVFCSDLSSVGANILDAV